MKQKSSRKTEKGKPIKGSASIRGSKPTARKRPKDRCINCSKELKGEDRVLFVEEEIGRMFCEEACISNYFSTDISKLEKAYFKRLSPSDLSNVERDSMAHLRWITLRSSDETWREKTLSGDYRYTLISEFNVENRRVWNVCICLFLRGEPSFLYLSIVSRNQEMVNDYRRGERVQRSTSDVNPQLVPVAGGLQTEESTQQAQNTSSQIDGLADAWTEDETIRAKLNQQRRENDIPSEDYDLYQGCFDETLESPDEVWKVDLTGKSRFRLFHFIREYPGAENSGFWYLIIARETEDDDEIEILDAFPTRDQQLVNSYRQGSQEVGERVPAAMSRIVH